MATLTIRGLDDQVVAALRVSAAEHGQSMEAEACEIPAKALMNRTSSLGTSMSARFAEFADFGVCGVDVIGCRVTMQLRRVTGSRDLQTKRWDGIRIAVVRDRQGRGE